MTVCMSLLVCACVCVYQGVEAGWKVSSGCGESKVSNNNRGCSSGTTSQATEKTKAKTGRLEKLCMRHAMPGRGRVTRAQKKRGTDSIIWQHLPEYLDKEVYESQWYYDNQEDGRAGNDNYHGGERNEDGAQ